MLARWNSKSVGSKIVLLVALASSAAVVLVAVTMLLQALIMLRNVSREFMLADAQMFAVNLAAPLAFNDQQAAADTLKPLEGVPNLVLGKVFDRDGNIFARMRETDRVAPITSDVPLGVTSQGTYMLVAQPIEHDGERLGTVVLVYHTGFLYRQVAIDSLVAVLIAAFAIATAVLLAIQLRRTITLPIEELSKTAANVSEREDYAARATKISDDEFGDLTDTFNHMLDRITEQAAVISEANEELRASNEEMEQFVYTVSHDLKSPLVTITGFAGLLREDMRNGSADEIDDSLTHIESASRKMGTLIEDLLHLSRVGRIEYHHRRVDVREVVDEVVANLDQLIESHQAVIEVDADTPAAWADRQRLLQLFQNLIENALKYGCPNLGDRVVISGRAVQDAVELDVRDFGPGIDADYHERVFGLFQRLASDQPGTGIGLAIAKRIAEAHQGSIRLESTPGEGCRFIVRLPEP